jgi:hypothetical protein
LNLIYLTEGDLVDRISSKDRPNDSYYKDILAQPLKLKDSLRIRDGLGGHDVRPVGWPWLKAPQFVATDFNYSPWISDN